MLRDYKQETEKRTDFIRSVIDKAGAKGIVYGNSGGKDSALVGALCRYSCENTLGIIMPCGSKRNYEIDKADAEHIAGHFDIDTRIIDLSAAREELIKSIGAVSQLNDAAVNNIAPRLRMSTLYAVASGENRLVSGTGNRSEAYMGYFTKWGDGACDFNPIADLTVTEIYEFLDYLGAPKFILSKAPSAGLFDGQTDESEMGVTYDAIDKFLLTGEADERDLAVIKRYNEASGHKRTAASVFIDD